MATSPVPPSSTLATVGEYQLLALLGEGGMGVVYLARKVGGENVALKMLRPHLVGDDQARARLAREVNALRLIRSDWVAGILDANPWAVTPYVVTRYVEGPSLDQQVSQAGPLTGQVLTRFAEDLAEGLAAVHAVGVLHRDIKPSNVLLAQPHPVLIDFGLARLADESKVTRAGWLAGTPGYLAPEILQGADASTASDVHSWAATVAFAALGRSPFGDGPAMAVMDRVRRGEYDLTGLPGPLARVLADALSPQPVRRPSLAAIAHRLRNPDSEGEWTQVAPVPATLTAPLVSSPALVRPRPQPVPLDLSVGDRLRAGALFVALALASAAGIAAFPWLVAFGMGVAAWLLRSGWRAASAQDERRYARGPRWYDGPRTFLSTPWHALRTLGVSIGLTAASAFLGVLVGVLVWLWGAGQGWTLFLAGLVFAVSLAAGPGTTGVRAPLLGAVLGVAGSAGRWRLAMVVVLAVAALAGMRVDLAGPTWTPGEAPTWMQPSPQPVPTTTS